MELAVLLCERVPAPEGVPDGLLVRDWDGEANWVPVEDGDGLVVYEGVEEVLDVCCADGLPETLGVVDCVAVSVKVRVGVRVVLGVNVGLDDGVELPVAVIVQLGVPEPETVKAWLLDCVGVAATLDVCDWLAVWLEVRVTVRVWLGVTEAEGENDGVTLAVLVKVGVTDDVTLMDGVQACLRPMTHMPR